MGEEGVEGRTDEGCDDFLTHFYFRMISRRRKGRFSFSSLPLLCFPQSILVHSKDFFAERARRRSGYSARHSSFRTKLNDFSLQTHHERLLPPNPVRTDPRSIDSGKKKGRRAICRRKGIRSIHFDHSTSTAFVLYFSPNVD